MKFLGRRYNQINAEQLVCSDARSFPDQNAYIHYIIYQFSHWYARGVTIIIIIIIIIISLLVDYRAET